MVKKAFYTGRIDFLGKAKYLVPLSFILVAAALVEIAFHGLDYGIDFAGGTEIQVQFQSEVGAEALTKSVEDLGYKNVSVQKFAEGNEYLIRLASLTGENDQDANQKLNQMIKAVTDAIGAQFADQKPNVRRVDSVGPQAGSELKRNGLLATFYSLLVILIYIGLRFDYKYAPGAVFSLFHDVVITLGIFSVLDHEVNLQTLASVLTLIGYSLNDTIINFDRIRENEKLHPDQDIVGLVNLSVNEMLSRTVLTSLTTLFACATLYIFADGSIRDIAFTLGIGIVIGTYSSIYIAAPLMIATDRWEKRKTQARLKTARVG
jgi:preprotein translocase subunit SecF